MGIFLLNEVFYVAWQDVGKRLPKRRRSQCALEMPVAGGGRAIRKDSLPLERVIWPGEGSGGGRAFRCLEALARVGHAVVLAVLSGRVPSRKSNHQEGKSLLTLKFSAKRSIFTRKRMLYD